MGRNARMHWVIINSLLIYQNNKILLPKLGLRSPVLNRNAESEFWVK